MINDLRGRIQEAVRAYQEEDALTSSAIDATDTTIVAIRRLMEQNADATQATRVAYSFKGGMTDGGSDATRAHDQIRNILENQLRAAQAVRASLERISPLLAANASIAERMLGVIGS